MFVLNVTDLTTISIIPLDSFGRFAGFVVYHIIYLVAYAYNRSAY
jgi:hypothetical protein